MAGASDKARFYLEQSVPELQELLRKQIFSKNEISSIARKRSEFEHRINARGPDYARYVEYEMNLENLRRKRVKRLGIKSTSSVGQRRVFFIFDRATKHLPGDLGLWLQYLDFARKQKARTKVSQILTNVLRLHPTKSEFWIYAANYVFSEQGDIIQARSYMHRGLRFCQHSTTIWSEYLKLEMAHLSKVNVRRQVLGIDKVNEDINETSDYNDFNSDAVPLIKLTPSDVDPIFPSNKSADEAKLQKLNSSHAQTGAIPSAIVNAALKQSPEHLELGSQLFDVLAAFGDLRCTKSLVQQIVDELSRTRPKSPTTLDCFIRQPFHGLSATSVAFPEALRTALQRLNKSMSDSSMLDSSRQALEFRVDLSSKTIDWILEYLEDANLDPAVRQILKATLRKTWSFSRQCIEYSSDDINTKLLRMASHLRNQGYESLVEPDLITALQKRQREPNRLAMDKGSD
ncbi:MAG: hypothetical protein Q9167_000054 [Letrouitia subvulpina]